LHTTDSEYYRLRTEWLRFKSHLVDRLTGLPALPAVIEEVRRIVESGGSADVVYLDLGRSGWHETQLGWSAYDETIRNFARLLGSLRETGEIGPLDLLCLHTVRSDRFLIFAPGSPLEGPKAAGARKGRLLGALRDRGAGNLRVASGHAHVRKDPMIRSERAIQQAVADAMLLSLADREGTEAARREELSRMIAEGAVRAVFEPVVRLADLEVIGHEALTRPLRRESFDSVEDLFSFAETTELLTDFERLCRRTAIESTSRLARRGLLFLNASARAVEDAEWSSGAMERILGAAGLAPRDVVVEITERLAVVKQDGFHQALRLLKSRGYRVAVDDMGAGYASLQALASLEPDFLKFDVSLVRDIHKSGIKRSLLESLRGLAEKIRAHVIAEGVEQEEERQTLLSLRIELAQGFLFHREPRA
jgi:EAL domain-containing protein (putative c-di-GMP-specific phosphodiesterase class I)